MTTTGIVIPAHMRSSRFPGKPLVDVAGKPLLAYSIECSRATGLPYVVATSDKIVLDWCYHNSVPYIETYGTIRNGTERARLANREMWQRVIVFQCDEPDVQSDDILRLTEVPPPATLVGNMADSDWRNPNTVAAEVWGQCVRRFVRNPSPQDKYGPGFLRHIGIYLYSSAQLEQYVAMEPTDPEVQHSLEQLRTMALGYSFLAHNVHPPRCTPSRRSTYRSVNVPEDLEAFK